jgi:hypothetical protein
MAYSTEFSRRIHAQKHRLSRWSEFNAKDYSFLDSELYDEE